MKAIKAYIASQFSKPTGLGGKISTWFMNQLNHKQYNAVIQKTGNLHKEEKVLDIGFGNGKLIKKLAQNNTATFYGIEISEDMIKAASDENKALLDSDRLFLYIADVQKMPFGSDIFDKIYTVNTVYFWNNPLKGFEEIARVLNPDGVFYLVGYTKVWLDKLSYTNYGFLKYKSEELIDLAEKAGLYTVENLEIKSNTSFCLSMKKKKKL